MNARRDRTLLVAGLGAGAEFALRTLLRLPYRLVLLDHPGSALLPLADVPIPLAWDAPADEVAAVLDGAVDRYRPAGMLTFVDEWLPLVAATARRHGLPAHDAAAAEAAADKVAMRRRFDAVGVPQTAWRETPTLEAAVAAARELGFPAVVKPANGSNSIGVSRVVDEAQARRAYKLAWLLRRHGTGGVLVERWQDGNPVDVHTVSRGGTTRAVIVFRATNELRGDRPVNLGYHGPYTDDLAVACARVAAGAVAATGIANGVSLVELTVCGGQPQVIEVNGRLGGGGAAEIVYRCGGPNLIATSVALATGDPLPPELVDVFTVDEPLLPIPWRAGGAVHALDRVGRLDPATVRAAADEDGIASVVIQAWADGPYRDREEIDNGQVVALAANATEAAARAARLADRLAGSTAGSAVGSAVGSAAGSAPVAAGNAPATRAPTGTAAP